MIWIKLNYKEIILMTFRRDGNQNRLYENHKRIKQIKIPKYDSKFNLIMKFM